MDGMNIDGVKFTGFVNTTSNTGRTEGSKPLFATQAADDGGFYPGLRLSPEARMKAFLTGNPMMLILNDLQGIKY